MGTRNHFHYRAYFNQEQFGKFASARHHVVKNQEEWHRERGILEPSITCATEGMIHSPLYEVHTNPDGLICVSAKGCNKMGDINFIAEELAKYTEMFSILVIGGNNEHPQALHVGIDYDHLSVDKYFSYNYDDKGLSYHQDRVFDECKEFELMAITFDDLENYIDMTSFPDAKFTLDHPHTVIRTEFACRKLIAADKA